MSYVLMKIGSHNPREGQNPFYYVCAGSGGKTETPKKRASRCAGRGYLYVTLLKPEKCIPRDRDCVSWLRAPKHDVGLAGMARVEGNLSPRSLQKRRHDRAVTNFSQL